MWNLKMDSKSESINFGKRISLFSAVSFGEISNSARRRGLGRNAGFCIVL